MGQPLQGYKYDAADWLNGRQSCSLVVSLQGWHLGYA